MVFAWRRTCCRRPNYGRGVHLQCAVRRLAPTVRCLSSGSSRQKMAFSPGCRSRVARTKEQRRRLLCTGVLPEVLFVPHRLRTSPLWPRGRIHSGHLACGPSHLPDPASLTTGSKHITVRFRARTASIGVQMQSADGLKLVWQKGDSATTSDTGFGSRTLGCLLADGVGICARVVPSVCTCSALLGSGSMAIQELGVCPYLSPQITRSGRSYGSTVSNVCFTSGTLSLPKLPDRWHPQCAASPGSRAVGSLTVGNARLATIMGIVKAISSLGLCCGLWFARALLVERTPGSDGGAKWILQALAASDRWACALIFPLELLRSCCSYDSTGRDVSLRRDVLSVPEPARSVAVVRC